MMKRKSRLGKLALLIVLFVVATAVAIFSLGCRTTPADGPSTAFGSQKESVLDRVRRDQIIHAGYIVYPPFVTKDPNTGKLGGMFIDLVDEVAQRTKVKVDYTETKWATMLPELKSGKYDIVVSGVFPTVPRAMEASFARPLLYVSLIGMVRRDDKRFSSPEDLGRAGVRVAMVNGGSAQEFMKRFFPEKSPILLDTADAGRGGEEVRAGRADIALADSITCAGFAKAHPDDIDVAYTQKPLAVTGVTVMLRRDDAQWQSFWDTSFDALQATGILREIEKKYKTNPTLWRSRRQPWE